MFLKKACFYFLAVFTGTFSLLLLVSLLPRRWAISYQEDDVTICVNQVGIHTNIIVPIQHNIYNWQQFLNLKEIGKEPSGNYQYLGFGWGDRDFYPTNPSQFQEIITLGVQALFFSRGSVMRVEGYPELPQNHEIHCVGVSTANYLNTVQFIQNSFELTPQRQIILFVRSEESEASYYKAEGQYSVFRNSNNWTAEGLRKANINTPLWAGIPQAVMFHVSRNPQ
ncbi:DUF2459 domain-containing protein [Gloeocapsopsis dulcis]|uniref:DUF2459 domain-containing protein n=1 Tax=Gloeocapsopsis dulcis AAB1 = 1H9 TaxID=1433147 RepID=A0A6N8FSS0_9CHRO|nr:DUF2459 domain-containing protein [Gloeocapsopsis dulcis]MUL36180.1 hypothetical protein [Gloeocapsopsis dulcis AAB1 = 1H9]WNN91344.1 DUF2459 domain-containing protein [Gloeocapsopsis dulcis]